MGSKAGIASETELRLPIAALKADTRNPRSISREAVSGLAVSLETFGPLDIVFNDSTGELVGGHQRVNALTEAVSASICTRFAGTLDARLGGALSAPGRRADV
jgi:hypothetical protein